MSIVDERGVIVHPYRSAVLGDDPILQVERVARGVRSARLGHHGLAVVGVEHPHPQPGLGQALLGGVAGERLVLRADVDRGGDLVDLVDVDDRRDPLDQVAVARLGLALTRLGLAPGRDVLDHALPHRPRSVAFDQEGGVPYPHDRSVRTQEPVLDLEALSGSLRPSVLLQDPIPVVGMDQLHPRVRLRHPFARRDAGQLLDLRRDVRQPVVAVRILLVGEVGHDRQLLDQLPVALLRPLLLGDVEHHALVEGAPARPRRDRERPRPGSRPIGRRPRACGTRPRTSPRGSTPCPRPPGSVRDRPDARGIPTALDPRATPCP